MQRRPISIRETTNLSGAVRRGAVLFMAASIGSSAGAQTSGSVSIVSDYRFRGMSLSDGHPEPQFHLGYDSKNGWYAGAFASGVKLEGDKSGDAQLMAYAGYSGQRQSGSGWEFGVATSRFARAADFGYTEVFVGFASSSASGRLYFSPDYFGRQVSTLYGEFNSSYRLSERLHLLGHVGLLQTLSGPGKPAARLANQVDIRAGASAALGDWHIQLAWTAAKKANENSGLYGNSNRNWTLSASYLF